MARPPKTTQVKADFLSAIGSARQLFVDIRSVTGPPGAAHPSLHPKQARRAYALAFLGVSASWEEFLEQSMTRLMCGVATPSGVTPTLRGGKCHDLNHAYQILTGKVKYDPETDHMSWTSPKLILSRAMWLFDSGGPYKVQVTQFADELARAVAIRNRVAHASMSSKTAFLETARHYMKPVHHPGPAPFVLPQGFGVGDLLLATHVRGFTHLPAPTPAAPRTYFVAFMDMYELLANAILP